MNILMLGSGAWGTALANLLCENGHHVILWNKNPARADEMRRTRCNPRLRDVALHPVMAFTAEISAAADCEMVVFATPSFAIRETAALVKPFLRKDAILVSVTKGIEAETGLRMSQIIEQETGMAASALSGPSHAEEVSKGIPTGCVAACADITVAETIQDTFMNDTFRVYASTDVVGVELSAAMKNVIALCAGVSDGLGMGDNTKALLVTRGLTELARLVVAMGGSAGTIAGLAGVGDMIVTCTSMHSRNRRAGILIGQGVPVAEAMQQVGAVVEGYYAALSAWQLSCKAGVEMPICQQAYAVLYEGKSAADSIHELMCRGKKHEFEDAGWA